MGLQVDRAARVDERGDVGDGVADQVTPFPALDVERLVEVHRFGRVDGDKGDVGLIVIGQARLRSGFVGGGLHLRGKADFDVHLPPEVVQSPEDHGIVGGLETAGWHRSILTSPEPTMTPWTR